MESVWSLWVGSCTTAARSPESALPQFFGSQPILTQKEVGRYADSAILRQLLEAPEVYSMDSRARGAWEPSNRIVRKNQFTPGIPTTVMKQSVFVPVLALTAGAAFCLGWITRPDSSNDNNSAASTDNGKRSGASVRPSSRPSSYSSGKSGARPVEEFEQFFERDDYALTYPNMGVEEVFVAEGNSDKAFMTMELAGEPRPGRRSEIDVFVAARPYPIVREDG